MTIPELTALSDDELNMRLYRDVLGMKAKCCGMSHPWFIWDAHFERALTAQYATESEAWAALPPVEPSVWLAEMDKLVMQNIAFTSYQWSPNFAACSVEDGEREPLTDVPPFFIPQTPTATEALKRAVMIASIFTHQQKGTA